MRAVFDDLCSINAPSSSVFDGRLARNLVLGSVDGKMATGSFQNTMLAMTSEHSHFSSLENRLLAITSENRG